MISQIARNSMMEGRRSSRLPTFSKEWIDKIRSSADFFGFNYYSSRYVKTLDKPAGPNPSYFRDRNITRTVSPEWKNSSGFYSVPKGCRDILRYWQCNFTIN